MHLFTTKRKTLEVVSLSLSLYFVPDVEGSVIFFSLLQSSTCSYLAPTIAISSLSILFFVFACAGFFLLRDLICCLLQSVFRPIHNLSGIGVREDERDTHKEDRQ
jgi:hypothetical protein